MDILLMQLLLIEYFLASGLGPAGKDLKVFAELLGKYKNCGVSLCVDHKIVVRKQQHFVEALKELVDTITEVLITELIRCILFQSWYETSNLFVE